jgi:hypothetical protein
MFVSVDLHLNVPYHPDRQIDAFRTTHYMITIKLPPMTVRHPHMVGVVDIAPGLSWSQYPNLDSQPRSISHQS